MYKLRSTCHRVVQGVVPRTSAVNGSPIVSDTLLRWILWRAYPEDTYPEDTGLGVKRGAILSPPPLKHWIWRKSCSMQLLMTENAKNSYLIPNKIISFHTNNIGNKQQCCLVFEKKIFFGEEGVLNLIWIPSTTAVFNNSFWHYAQTCRFLIFFFFLIFEMFTPYPISSFPLVTVSTVVKKIQCHSITVYQIKSNSIRHYQILIVSDSDTIISDSDTVTQ